MRTIEDIVILACDYLNSKDILYVVVGGVIIPYLGAPRTTVDVDLIIKMSSEKLSDFIDFMESNDFHASEEDLRAALEEESHCTIEDKTSPYRLDVKGVYTEHDEFTLKRRMKVEYKRTAIYIPSPEDAIVSKILFGSEQDIKDATSIYIRQKDSLDEKYIEKISSKLGVLDRYKKMKKGVENRD